MKKNILGAIMLMATLMYAVPADAQLFKFGIKAGLNINSFNLSNGLSNVSADNQCGFFAGLTTDITIPVAGLGVDASVMYEMRKTKLVQEGDNGVYQNLLDETNNRIIVPINLKYTIGFSSMFSIYGATGPQFGFDLKGKSLNDLAKDANFKTADFSWNVGAGFTISKHYRLGYNYNIPLGKTADVTAKQVWNSVTSSFETPAEGVTGSVKSNTHQISFTYIF